METSSIFVRQVYAQDTEPVDTRDGVMWVDTSSTTRETYVYAKGSSKWEPVAPANDMAKKNHAETFAESNVTVNNPTPNTEIKNESINLLVGEQMGNGTSGTTAVSYKAGPVFVPVGDEIDPVLYFYVDEECTATRIQLTERATGSVIDEMLGGPWNGWVKMSITGTLTGGNEYGALADGEGATYDMPGGTNTYNSTTITGYDLVDWYENADWDSAYSRNINYVGLGETSASVTIEWPYPSDVYSWDTATYQRTLDNEGVDVYVEESSDGGSTWTEIAGPISRGQDITADSNNECRFRVDISRSSTANEPSIDAIYQRWTL